MIFFRLFILAACLLVLGFDLARDGSKQTRLRLGIETQKQELRRLRQDLSSMKSSYNARLLGITWDQPRVEVDEADLAYQISETVTGIKATETSIPLDDHLNIERGNEY